MTEFELIIYLIEKLCHQGSLNRNFAFGSVKKRRQKEEERSKISSVVCLFVSAEEQQL